MTDIVDRIADCLIGGHVAIMTENKCLRDRNERLKGVVRSMLENEYNFEMLTPEYIDYEISQGNGIMRVVKEACELLAGPEERERWLP